MTPDAARGRLRIFAIGIAALFLGLAFANYWTGRDELRAGSKSLPGGAVRVTHVPSTYRVVYRLENRAGGSLVMTTEKVWVRRPFASRVETFRGEPPGTPPRSSLRQSNFGILANRSSGSDQPLNISAPPSIGSGDLRVDSVLEEAMESGAFLRRERREVYGRQCQVYRAGGPVFAGDVTPYERGSDSYTDLCVDRNGIVIEEYWVEDGELLRRRAAVELEIDPPLSRALFDIDVPVNPAVDRGAVERIPSGAVTGLWVLPEHPDGFERLGRYAVLISKQAIPQLGGGAPGAAPSSTSDVYVRGPDLVVVDQDPSLAELVVLEKRPSKKVKLGILRRGQLIVDARMNEVRGVAPDGSVVRVFGTLPPSELVELARKLEPLDNQ